MANESEARVYGMADQANQPPPAAQGVRGEKAAAGDADADYRHEVTLDGGKQIAVTEDSGVAYAEATGRAGLSRRPAPERRVERGREPLSAPNELPLMIGLAISVGILALTIWRLRSGEQGESPRHDRVPPRGVVRDSFGNGNVWDQPGIGFRPVREIADQGQVHFQSAR